MYFCSLGAGGSSNLRVERGLGVKTNTLTWGPLSTSIKMSNASGSPLWDPTGFGSAQHSATNFSFWSNFGCRHNVECKWVMATHRVTISHIQPYNQPCPQLHLTPVVKGKCRVLCLGRGKRTSVRVTFIIDHARL